MFNLALLQNYLSVLGSNTRKYYFQFLLVVIGLATGIFSAATILYYTLHELSYDKQFTDTENVFRVAIDLPEIELGGEGIALTPAGLKAYVNDITAGRHTVARALPINSFIRLYHGQKRLTFPTVVAAEQEFVSIFDFPLISGEFKLSAPGTMVISESLAKKIFNSTDVIGKTFKLENRVVVTVTGVMADLPVNTHLRFDAMISMITVKSIVPNMLDGFRGGNFYTYVKPSSDIDINSFVERVNERLSDAMQVKVETIVQPLSSIHLESHLLGEMKTNGDKRLLYLLNLITVMLMVITTVNFYNTNSAFYSARLKELSVRKAIGASDRQIFSQLLVESLCIIAVAILVSTVAFEMLAAKLEKLLNINLVINLDFAISVVIIACLLNVLGNLVPMYKASKTDVHLGLKGILDSRFKRQDFSRILLVCLQSFFTVILLVLSFVMYEQSNLLANKNLGYNKDGVFITPEITADEYTQRFSSFKTRALQIEGVEQVAVAEQFPTMAFNNSTSAISISGLPNTSLDKVPMVGVGLDFVEALNIKIIAGRTFSEKFVSDELRVDSTAKAHFGVLVSKAFVEQAGWMLPKEAINKTLTWGDSVATIVGVFDYVEFNNSVTHSTPVILAHSYNVLARWAVGIKLSSNAPRNSVATLQSLFNEVFEYPNANFDSLTKLHADQYQNFFRQLDATLMLTLLVIVLTFFGMFSLAKFACEKSVKEIAVRQILGAKLINIIGLLSFRYFFPVVIAAVIALPISWQAAATWLTAFDFEGGVSGSHLFVALFSTLVITVLTVCWVIISSNHKQPVEVLKND